MLSQHKTREDHTFLCRDYLTGKVSILTFVVYVVFNDVDFYDLSFFYFFHLLRPVRSC